MLQQTLGILSNNLYGYYVFNAKKQRLDELCFPAEEPILVLLLLDRDFVAANWFKLHWKGTAEREN